MSHARQIRWWSYGTLTAAMLIAWFGAQAQEGGQAPDDSPQPRGVRRGRGGSNAVPFRSSVDADRPVDSPAGSNDRLPIDTSRNQREVYRASYIPVVSLASTLERHFRGVPGVSLIAEPASNSLLLSADSERMKDLVDTIRILDRTPRSATIEVTFLNISDADERKEVHAQEFVGPSDRVCARVHELKKSGQIEAARRFCMTVLDNQLTHLQTNGDKPGAGNAVQPGGFPGGAQARQNAARSPGASTTIQCTARISMDKPVVAELAIHDTPATRGPQQTPEEIAAHFLGTLSIPPSTTVVAGEISTQSENGPSRIVILVSAAVVQAPSD